MEKAIVKETAKEMTKEQHKLVNDFVKSEETLTVKAVKLMVAFGYDETKGHKENGLVFKAVKQHIKTTLEIHLAPFAVKDGSQADKRYNSLVAIINRACETGLKNGLEPKETAKRGAKQKAGNVILKEKAIKPVELPQDMADDIMLERDFRGSIADFMEIYETEVFNYIASDEELLARFLLVIKNGKQVQE